MKTITIVSGKGGVGKSSIIASLGISLSRKHKIITADCDVDASNLALVFGVKEKDFIEWEDISTNQKAVFDVGKCSSCGACFKECYFDAINWKSNKPQLKQFSCEGCGVCELLCPSDAIKIESVVNAKIGYAKTKYGFKLVSAQLIAGASGSGKLVTAVKNRVKEMAQDAEFMLTDSAAGIGCPVIASITGSDYCVVVVEPTPSSLFDMKRVFKIIDHFKIPTGIVINKFDINYENCKLIEIFAKRKKVKILGKLPFSRSFVDALVEMIPVFEKNEDLKKTFNCISGKIVRELTV